jgi:hypothetical protein
MVRRRTARGLKLSKGTVRVNVSGLSGFPYQDNPPTAMAVDANDNLYTLWSTSGNCEIVQQSLYNAEYYSASFNKIAGGRICGFSGNGVPAGNAEIGT